MMMQTKVVGDEVAADGEEAEAEVAEGAKVEVQVRRCCLAVSIEFDSLASCCDWCCCDGGRQPGLLPWQIRWR